MKTISKWTVQDNETKTPNNYLIHMDEQRKGIWVEKQVMSFLIEI
jgi:hypothetical protein